MFVNKPKTSTSRLIPVQATVSKINRNGIISLLSLALLIFSLALCKRKDKLGLVVMDNSYKPTAKFRVVDLV